MIIFHRNTPRPKAAVEFLLPGMRHIATHIFSAVDRAERILLVPHQHPDGDALGSCLAFLSYLQGRQKSAKLFCRTNASPRLSFLPRAETLITDESVWSEWQPDLVIVFDSGDLRYAGIADLVANQTPRPTVIAIDHHVTNERYGDLNLVDPTASSTAEVLYHLFRAQGIRATREMATALMTGLMTDTDNFTNGATTPSALLVGHELLLAGADRRAILASVFHNKTVGTLKLWGATLSRLARHETLDLVYTHVSMQDIVFHRASENDVDGIANYLNALGEGRATLLLKELPDGAYKGSFRTTRDNVDVSLVAKHLGGGGHKKAAGFTVPGPLKTALASVFDAARLYFPPIS